MTRREGTLVRWDAGKGFGFIRGDAGTQELFVHIRDFRAAGGAAPQPGLRVSFEDIHVGGKGPRAVAVQPLASVRASARPPSPVRVSPRPRPHRSSSGRGAPRTGFAFALPLFLAYGSALVWLAWQRQLPWWILPASLLLNLAAFFAYWQDKFAAQQGRWRTPEATLHLWSLAGGWAGAWLAQQALRHKSAKGSFRAVYWFTVVLHCGAAVAAWWSWRSR